MTFGTALKEHRTARRLSQLALATSAEVSQRHLSFLETGRAKPSREMVIHLGIAMGLGLREQNEILHEAGFAPAYPETGLDEPAMDEVRHVLELLLEAHDPFPAFAIDRQWNAVMMNRSGTLLASMLGIEEGDAPNLLKVAMRPDGMQRFCVNWDEVAVVLVQRLHREVLSRPGDEALREVYEEVMSYPGLPSPNDALLPSGSDLLIPIHYRFGDIDVRLISTITTLGAAYDVTLEELRLEVSYPADAASEAVLRGLAGA
jgi:transcriptional regulator with XRE-family HTH domain